MLTFTLRKYGPDAMTTRLSFITRPTPPFFHIDAAKGLLEAKQIAAERLFVADQSQVCDI